MAAPDDAAGNREIIRRVFGVFASGDLAILDELVAADYTNHDAPPGAPQGRDGRKRVVAMFRAGFPDVASTIEEIIAEGDRVVVRATLSGTNTGEFMGRPPTGRPISVSAIDIFRIADGQVTDRWGVLDMQGLIGQLQADGS
jgi:steroid delta-isomerase-like uncharacterized protein